MSHTAIRESRTGIPELSVVDYAGDSADWRIPPGGGGVGIDRPPGDRDHDRAIALLQEAGLFGCIVEYSLLDTSGESPGPPLPSECCPRPPARALPAEWETRRQVWGVA